MQLRRPSDAPAVTGRVSPWHLTLMDIPSAGADPVTSVHKNSFAGGAAGRGAFAIRALRGFWLWVVFEVLRESRAFFGFFRGPRTAPGFFFLTFSAPSVAAS